MIARRQLDPSFAAWNRRWAAPFGWSPATRLLPHRCWLWPPLPRLVGAFAFQVNSATRRFEYPWAFANGRVAAGQTAVDLGGGLSGFPFVLARCGLKVTLVDPFLDYGSALPYPADPGAVVARLNRGLGTAVTLVRAPVDRAGIADASVDRVFSISTLEHLSEDAALSAVREVHRVLKPGGRLVLTVDLFLNLSPFTRRQTNRYGRNLSVADLVAASGLALVEGTPAELVGFPEFAPEAILARLDEFLLVESYPVLTQALVLEKTT